MPTTDMNICIIKKQLCRMGSSPHPAQLIKGTYPANQLMAAFWLSGQTMLVALPVTRSTLIIPPPLAPSNERESLDVER